MSEINTNEVRPQPKQKSSMWPLIKVVLIVISVLSLIGTIVEITMLHVLSDVVHADGWAFVTIAILAAIPIFLFNFFIGLCTTGVIIGGGFTVIVAWNFIMTRGAKPSQQPKGSENTQTMREPVE